MLVIVQTWRSVLPPHHDSSTWPNHETIPYISSCIIPAKASRYTTAVSCTLSPSGVRPTIVIAAWGDEATVSNHVAKVGQAQVTLFGDDAGTDPLLEVVKPETKYFDVVAVGCGSRAWYYVVT